MPTAEYTLRRRPSHEGQTVSASSLKLCTTSRGSPHSVQTYWYVGTWFLLAGTLARRLLNSTRLSSGAATSGPPWQGAEPPVDATRPGGPLFRSGPRRRGRSTALRASAPRRRASPE